MDHSYRPTSAQHHEELLQLQAPHHDDDSDNNDNGLFKNQITSHPLYPHLLSAYISCLKVGADPETVSLLEEIGIGQQRHLLKTPPPHHPQDLDNFMESYCGVLERYKEELCKAFDEASFFLSTMQSKLTHLCNSNNTLFSISSSSLPRLSTDDEASGMSKEKGVISIGDEGGFGGDEKELREMLLQKYSGYLSSLRKELLKKKKKNKLPKEARITLLQWWNNHYRWPYPTEEEKMKLSEMTGLDQKQINNWFINQRKRHWKPSQDMHVSLMEGAIA